MAGMGMKGGQEDGVKVWGWMDSEGEGVEGK